MFVTIDGESLFSALSASEEDNQGKFLFSLFSQAYFQHKRRFIIKINF